MTSGDFPLHQWDAFQNKSTALQNNSAIHHTTLAKFLNCLILSGQILCGTTMMRNNDEKIKAIMGITMRVPLGL